MFRAHYRVLAAEDGASQDTGVARGAPPNTARGSMMLFLVNIADKL